MKNRVIRAGSNCQRDFCHPQAIIPSTNLTATTKTAITTDSTSHMTLHQLLNQQEIFSHEVSLIPNTLQNYSDKRQSNTNQPSKRDEKLESLTDLPRADEGCAVLKLAFLEHDHRFLFETLHQSAPGFDKKGKTSKRKLKGVGRKKLSVQ